MPELPLYPAPGEREAPGYQLERRRKRLMETGDASRPSVFRKLKENCVYETLRLTGAPLSFENVAAGEGPLVRGVVDALDRIERAAMADEDPTASVMKDVHRLALPSGDGKFRTMDSPPQFGARSCPARFVPARISNLVEWLGAESARSMFPAERMALFFARFLEIAPFEHGNFRVAHLVLNFFAYRAGFPSVSLRLEEAAEIRNDVEKAIGFETWPLVQRLSDALSRSLSVWEDAALDSSQRRGPS